MVTISEDKKEFSFGRKNSLLSIIPPPELNRVGWPWTEESEPLPPLMPSGKPWPKISIVTPSYNQGQFLEETIRSVLLQNYPNLEYIIMDGGSTDNSVEIIKKYEPWLTYWVSEKDNGQAEAIYRGFEMSSGDILGWINSDDYYLPGAFYEVAKIFGANDTAEVLLGGCLYIRANGKQISKNYGLLQSYNNLLQVGMFTSQPSTFWKRSAYILVGGVDSLLQFCMDYDLFLKLQKRSLPIKTSKMLSAYRFHDETKSTKLKETLAKEDYLIGLRYGRYATPDHERDLLRTISWKKYNRNQRLQFLFELYHDPLYFLKYSINCWLKKLGLRT